MKTFTIPALFAFILILGAGCNGSDGPTGTSADDVIKEVDKMTTVKDLPDNLVQCDPKFFERGEDGIAPDCDTFGGDAVCSYYTEEKKGKTKQKLMQFDNACAACRFFSEEGVRDMFGTVMTHHGYTETKCEGAIWK